MSVRPILLQSDGAIKGIPGAYRTSPPPIAGKYAGSDALEDVTYYTVNASGEAELKTVKAYPFYCDSVSGGLDTSGDGTLANPWRSINHALTMIQPILICLLSRYCCPPYICLRVKGTIDYVVRPPARTFFDGRNRMIIEPYPGESLYMKYEIDYIRYCIFKKVKKNSTISYFFTECYNSIFSECEIDYVYNDSYGGTFGFMRCINSIFCKCKGNIKNEYPTPSGFITGFYGNDDSIFCESDSYIYGNFGINGFNFNRRSVFYSCNGFVYSPLSTGFGCGFYDNVNAVYINCTGNTVGSITCDI